MPFVSEMLRHDSFLDDLFYKVFRRFEDKTGNKWWQDFNDKVPKVDMYKITFEKGLFVKGGGGYKKPLSPKTGNVCITRHMIMRRWDNEYVAFAQSTGSFKINTADLPNDKTALMSWFVTTYKEFVDYTTVYAYMMENYLGYTHFEVMPTPPVVDEEDPDEEIPDEETPDEEIPTGSCEIHFTSLLMAGDQGDPDGDANTAFTEMYKLDGNSIMMGDGEYPDIYDSPMTGLPSSIGGLAVPAGVRLEVWSEPNFQGVKLFDKVGPLVMNDDWSEQATKDRVNASIDGSGYGPEYPESLWDLLEMWYEGSMKVTCGTAGGTPTTPPPTTVVYAQFGGGAIGGHSSFPGWISKVMEEDSLSDILPTGDYPKVSEALPNAFPNTWDSLVLPAGTRLEVWELEGFSGEKYFDKVGPLIHNKVARTHTDFTEINASLDSNGFATDYPDSVRLWGLDDDAPYSNGSFKITSAPTTVTPNKDTAPVGTITPVTIMTDDGGFGVLKSSLDIEYYSEDEYYPETMQSPIMVMKLKGDTGTQVASIGKLNYKTNTNWWDDSLIQLKGVFDETSAYFTLKVDSAPAWEDNLVTIVPFFFGNLVMGDATKRNETPIAMFGGTQVDKFFNFDSIEETTELLQPITRNYVNHPSNGVDTVMVKKTKYGARYQEHFLRWNAPPNLMPPTREEIRLAGGDLKLAKVHTSGSLPDLFSAGDSTIQLGWYTSGNNSYPISGLYSGARYVIIGEEEIATLQSIDLVNSTITLSRKSSKEWAAGTSIKAYTSDSLAEITRKYPRAWNYLRFGYYQYDFHPSRYSDKIHSSRATVMHPEDGVIGHVPNIVLLPVVNIMNGDKLKFPYWCSTCTEEPYYPETPETPPLVGWQPKPTPGTTVPPTPDPDEPSTPPTSGDFAYVCDNSVAASTVDSTYWNPDASLQNFMLTTGLGRELSTEFWQGRNDWLDFFGSPSDSDGVFNSPASKVTIEDFHSYLWKAIQDVKAGTQKNNSSWTDFNTWATTDLSCLTELERASLFMSTKLAKPVMFFPSSEGYLAGDILDNMIPAIEKVPTEVYDFMDFNNVFVEAAGSSGIVGAWVRDAGLMSTNQTTGVVTDGAPSFKSMVSFEPQLLQYGIGSAKANRPFDYLKTQPGATFGSPVIGGEYTSYYKTEMTDTNFTPFVAAEIAVHEMAHALSNYGRDKLGTVLHEMPDWLSISWGVDSKGKWDGINPTKSNPGTLLDNGKLAPVSDYGCFQPAEDFAEAFMIYVINRPFLNDKFKAKHDFIASKLQAMGINPNL